MSTFKSLYCYIIIIVVTYLVFQNTLENNFVFDDESVIIGNTSIKDLSNIPKFFTAEEGFHKVIGRYYRPVISSTYALDYSVWELDPYGYHLTNIIIHIISCLLLFKILSTLFFRYKYRNLISLFSTLIFAVHPIHTEAVSWVSGRTDSLVTLFFFASFLFYIEFTRESDSSRSEKSDKTSVKKNYLYLGLSLFFYATGLLTKEMIVTMPVIILLYDLVYRKKDIDYIKENIISYVLFFGVTIIYLILRYSLLADIPERETYLYFFGKDYTVVIGTMIKTIPVYFRLLFAPFPLLYHYNGVIPDAKTLIDSAVIFSFLFIVFLIFIAVYFYKKDSIISFCILFFLISLAPVMNIIPTMNLMAERFLYFTSFALVLLICHLAMVGSSKRDFSMLTIGMVVIICSLSYLTYIRNIDWKDNDSLYLSAKGVDGTVLLVNEGNIYANNKRYDDAKEFYKKAILLRENNVLAHHNLGLVYLLNGKIDSAEMRFKRGIQIDSLAPDGYFQMATVYNMKNDKDSAIMMLERLQKIAPNYKESLAILERIKSGGDTDISLNTQEFKNEETKSYQINLLQRRSYQFFNERKFNEAIKDLERLISLNTDPKTISGFMNNIAMCYVEMGKPEMAEKYFLDAVKTDSENINALNGLASNSLSKGDRSKAKEYLEMILKINPGDENARNKLDSLK
ncbi:MAG TPA: tetratricopeptide repeat protein [Ignavibacteria bacterium]|nr:tetratricopeptide repeat protein [Ignavibacteria bacterium]HMR40606.1 tetratricopeptide repeat protein [Ignavibacteria bacterium]